MRYPVSARKNRGAGMVEFALVIVMTCLLLFAGLEFGRMVLVYTDVASAARIGLRYAMTHGSKRSGTPGNPDGPATVAGIQAVVRDYAKSGTLDPSQLAITVTYPNTFKDPTFPVEIIVTYNYDPLTVLPLAVPLKTVTRGIITY